MTIFWTKIDLDDQTVATCDAWGFYSDTSVGAIHTRQWERDDSNGLHETLHLYMGLRNTSPWGTYHRVATWSYSAWGAPRRPGMARRLVSDWNGESDVIEVDSDYDVEAAISDTTPEDVPLMNDDECHCPAWVWTMTDVAEYRGLSSAASARRWIAERPRDIHVFGRNLDSGAKTVSGLDVIRSTRAMVGRGKGGGRPPSTMSTAHVIDTVQNSQ